MKWAMASACACLCGLGVAATMLGAGQGCMICDEAACLQSYVEQDPKCHPGCLSGSIDLELSR